jgi:hypothetical protein
MMDIGELYRHISCGNKICVKQGSPALDLIKRMAATKIDHQGWIIEYNQKELDSVENDVFAIVQKENCGLQDCATQDPRGPLQLVRIVRDRLTKARDNLLESAKIIHNNKMSFTDEFQSSIEDAYTKLVDIL